MIVKNKILFFVFLLFSNGNCECFGRSTCGECMEDPNCTWCSDVGYSQCLNTSQSSECKHPTNEKSILVVIEDEELNPDAKADFVQIRPQSLKLNLRLQESKKISFTIAQAKQYPVDIYFLLDLSWSIAKAQQYIATQAGWIIQEIQTITKDLHIGFGSFIDKNASPFTSEIHSFNCPIENPKCTPPYSFFHQKKLAQISEEELRETILMAPLGGNVDEPEGALDALLQVMVCHDRIGWREEARKIILLVTDRDFHYAMDSKLVGIFRPNDGLCHLNSSGYYTEELKSDYPSISQINSIAQMGSFIPIFAVNHLYKDIYLSLSQIILGSSMAILEKDASNIVDVIKNAYKDITSTIDVKVTNLPKYVSVKIIGDCGSATCKDVELGKSISFVAEIMITQCFKSSQILNLSPVGLNSSLSIDLNSICHCECENEREKQSEQCHQKGNYSCGLCNCETGYSGATCNCQEDFATDNYCIDPKSSGEICNSQGICLCGECLCDKNYGKYCECDDEHCLVGPNQLLCTGNGKCKCGKCFCDEHWSGEACECKKETSLCVSPYSSQLCTGNGNCRCNRCECIENEDGLFTGQHCEVWPNSIGPCFHLKTCVSCQIFEEKCEMDCEYNISTIQSAGNEKEQICEILTEDECTFRFIPRFNSRDGKLEIDFVLTESGEKVECPLPTSLAISAGVLGSLLSFGLILILIYKCYIVIEDKRQVAKFEEASRNLKYPTNQNSLYRNPVSTFINPMFKKTY